MQVSPLTQNRIIAALLVAALTDVIQLPITVGEMSVVGTAFALVIDFMLDVVVCVIISMLIGFHWALLPTFLVETIPGVDLLPTWVGCVLLVIRLRKKQARAIPPPMLPMSPPPVRASSAVIDI